MEHGLSGDGIFLISSFLIVLILVIATLIATLRIFKKAGYSQLLGLLMFIPFANIVVYLVLGFKKWPIEEELEKLKGTADNQLQ